MPVHRRVAMAVTIQAVLAAVRVVHLPGVRRQRAAMVAVVVAPVTAQAVVRSSSVVQAGPVPKVTQHMVRAVVVAVVPVILVARLQPVGVRAVALAALVVAAVQQEVHRVPVALVHKV